VAQGGATRVLDWRRHAGLDLAMALPYGLPSGASPADVLPTGGAPADVLPFDTLVRDVLEMRACLGADAARLCAGRASDAARGAVLAAVESYAGAGPDLDRMGEANVALWR